MVFWDGQCLTECPYGTYLNDALPEEPVCLPCSHPCEACAGDTGCFRCTDGFYLRGDECLESCPDGEYPNESLRICEDCVSPCLTCTGPLAEDCLKCDFEQKYIKGERGICTLKQCSVGEYPAVNYDEESVVCLSCGEGCEMCNSNDTCLECKSGFIEIIEESKIVCKTCEKINSGYYTDTNGQCKGIS